MHVSREHQPSGGRPQLPSFSRRRGGLGTAEVEHVHALGRKGGACRDFRGVAKGFVKEEEGRAEFEHGARIACVRSHIFCCAVCCAIEFPFLPACPCRQILCSAFIQGSLPTTW